MIFKQALVLAGVIACGACSVSNNGDYLAGPGDSVGGSGEPGLIIKSGIIEGVVYCGPVDSALVVAYRKTDAGREEIGRANVVNGHYRMEVSADDGVILIEAFSGEYTEESSNESVYIPAKKPLKSVVNYINGSENIVNVNLFTSIAAGKMEFLISRGTKDVDALAVATGAVESYLGADPFSVDPINPSSADAVDLSMDSPGLMIGLRTAVVSTLMGDVNTENGFPEHSIFTSVSFVSAAYNDVTYDGYLNGIGYRGDGSVGQMMFGSTEINEDFYRVRVSRNAIKYVFSNRNNSDVTFYDYAEEARRVSTFKGLLFNSVTLETIDDEIPDAEWNVLTREVIHLNKQFTINISDNVAIATATLKIGDYLVKEWSDVKSITETFDWDSSLAPDGRVNATLTVTDVFGNKKELVEPVSVQNVYYAPEVIPDITVTSALFVNNSVYKLTGIYDAHGAGLNTFTINGMNVSVDSDGMFEVNYNLAPGENQFEIYGETEYYKTNTISATVIFDGEKPVITVDSVDGSYSVYFEIGGTADQARVLDVLTLDTTSRPLAIPLEYISFDTLPLTVAEIESRKLPYLGFHVSDSDGVSNTTSSLNVTYTYSVNETPVFSDKILTTKDGDEYILVIAEESLGVDFYHTSPTDIHEVVVTVKDMAGNVELTNLRFKIEPYVSTIAAVTPQAAVNTTLRSTPFASRASLNSTFGRVVLYEVANPYSHDILVKPERTGTTARIVRNVEEHYKEHLVSRTTKTKFYGPSPSNRSSTVEIGEFFGMIAGSGAVQTDTGGIGIWAGLASDNATCLDQIESTGYSRFTPPADSTEVISINTDNTATNEQLAYEAIPGYVGASETILDRNGNNVGDGDVMLASAIAIETYLTPGFEKYCVAPSADWLIGHGLSAPTNDIAVQGFINGVAQARTITDVSEPGYPRVTSDITDDTYTSLSTTFTGFDDTDTELSNYSGWIRIPAGETVDIYLEVFTPNIGIADDPVDSIYAVRNTDFLLKWEASPNALFRYVPFTGIANINSISEFVVSYDEPLVSVQNVRP